MGYCRLDRGQQPRTVQPGKLAQMRVAAKRLGGSNSYSYKD